MSTTQDPCSHRAYGRALQITAVRGGCGSWVLAGHGLADWGDLCAVAGVAEMAGGRLAIIHTHSPHLASCAVSPTATPRLPSSTATSPPPSSPSASSSGEPRSRYRWDTRPTHHQTAQVTAQLPGAFT